MKKLFLYLSLMLCTALSLDAQNFFNQSDLQWVAVPNHADWNYALKEKAQLDVQLLWHGMPLADTEIRWVLNSDCLNDKLAEGTCKSNAKGEVVIDLGTRKEPGFSDCQMECTIDGKTFRNHVKVGFAPEKLKPYTQEPKDFDAFWQQVLQEQQQLPITATRTSAPEFSNDQIDCWKVKIRIGTPDRENYMYGYLSVPKSRTSGQKYPIVVSPPGAGVKHMDPVKTQFYASVGHVIRFEMEIHGIDPALSAEKYKEISAAMDYLSVGVESRDHYYMKRVYAGLVRAVDWLCTLDEWDGKNMMIQGNSQGGGLGLVLAALDKRITALAIAHPALCDMAGYAYGTGGYPHYQQRIKHVLLTPEVIETLSYYDGVNFAKRVGCPTYMTWGYNDNTCPPTTSWKVWNLLKCPKTSYITPINEHWISEQTRYRQMNFLLQHVR